MPSKWFSLCKIILINNGQYQWWRSRDQLLLVSVSDLEIPSLRWGGYILGSYLPPRPKIAPRFTLNMFWGGGNQPWPKAHVPTCKPPDSKYVSRGELTILVHSPLGNRATTSPLATVPSYLTYYLLLTSSTQGPGNANDGLAPTSLQNCHRWTGVPAVSGH